MIRLLPIVAASLMTVVVTGCATSGTTLVRPDRAGRVIYQISEQQAFTIALEAYAALYPKQSVETISSARRGGAAMTWTNGRGQTTGPTDSGSFRQLAPPPTESTFEGICTV